jgi:hypothetical protein
MPETTERAGPAPDEHERLRQGLLDQLRHLVRETDMLEGVIGRVPDKLLAEVPPDAENTPGPTHSIKETFALTARLDEAVHPERIRRIVKEDTPHVAPADPDALLADEDWNARPMAALFERVRAAREALAETLAAVPPADWQRTGFFPREEAADAEPDAEPDADAPQQQPGETAEGNFAERDLYEMAHALCRRDTARLQGMTRRLYESHLGPAPERGGSA